MSLFLVVSVGKRIDHETAMRLLSIVTIGGLGWKFPALRRDPLTSVSSVQSQPNARLQERMLHEVCFHRTLHACCDSEAACFGNRWCTHNSKDG